MATRLRSWLGGRVIDEEFSALTGAHPHLALAIFDWHAVAHAAKGEEAVIVELAHMLQAAQKRVGGQGQESRSLLLEELSGRLTGGLMDPLFASLLIGLDFLAQVRPVPPGAPREQARLQRVEGVLDFALGLRMLGSSGDGLDAVVAAEGEEARVPHEFLVPMRQHHGFGVVNDNEAAASAEVLQTYFQPFEDAVLALTQTGVEMDTA